MTEEGLKEWRLSVQVTYFQCVMEMSGHGGLLEFLLSASHLQEVFFLWRPGLPDPDDDLILELAVAAACR